MAKAKLGSGARFKALKKKVGSAAIAAHIGRKKHGKAKFQKLAAAGRKRRSKSYRGSAPFFNLISSYRVLLPLWTFILSNKHNRRDILWANLVCTMI